MKPQLAAAFLTAFMALFGCAHRYPPTPEADFNGISGEADNARIVRIFFIHGMGDHDPGYSAKIVERLVEQIGLEALGKPSDRNLMYRNGQIQAGHLRLQRFLRSGGKQEFRVVELTWSPLTSPLKNKYLGADRDPQYRWKRATFNKALKEGLVDRAISDALLYVGEFGDAMRWTVKEAICHMLNDQHESDAPCDIRGVDVPALEADQLVFVSWSLGSRMLLDSMLELMSDQRSGAAIEQAIAKTNLFFMLANQVSLLEMSNVREPLGIGRPESGEAFGGSTKETGLTGFVRTWSLIQRDRARLMQIPEDAARRPLRVVAFSDPNDLLSFEVSKDAGGGRKDVDFINVIVSNVPEFFGVLARPDTAHTTYGDNTGVHNLIICGSKNLAPACK